MTMKGCILILLLIACSVARTPDEFTIDLDDPAPSRYTHLAQAKAASINQFLQYLHTVPKYVRAFAVAH